MPMKRFLEGKNCLDRIFVLRTILYEILMIPSASLHQLYRLWKGCSTISYQNHAPRSLDGNALLWVCMMLNMKWKFASVYFYISLKDSYALYTYNSYCTFFMHVSFFSDRCVFDRQFTGLEPLNFLKDERVLTAVNNFLDFF